MPNYTGSLKPKNFEISATRLSPRAGFAGPQFLIASGKLQALCYKEEIESALRTPGMGGFELLALHDFPGQGTALVGVLDALWNPKGYITAAEFRRFCNSTVPLARLPARLHHRPGARGRARSGPFGPRPLVEASLAWKLVAEMASPCFGRGCPQDPRRQRRLARVRDDSPPRPARPGDTGWLPDWKRRRSKTTGTSGSTRRGWKPGAAGSHHHLPARRRAQSALKRGGCVLLLVPPGKARGDRRGKVALGFSSIFWNTAWTRRQPPHTLGILCDPKHPALAEFPTESHSNWQWWYLLTRADALILDDLPRDLHPLIQVIDDWVTNRRLGLVLEARVGGGKLLICSIDLERNLEANPVARQLRSSLLHYVAGERFRPAVELTVPQVRSLMKVDGISHAPCRVPAMLSADDRTTTLETDTATAFNLGCIWTICLVAALGGLLFGYDWVVIGGAKPFFERYFGFTATLQVGWAKSCALGRLPGRGVSRGAEPTVRAKTAADRGGADIRGHVVGTALADFTLFVLWRMLGGVAIGLASNLSPMYIAEIAPARCAAVSCRSTSSPS